MLITKTISWHTERFAKRYTYQRDWKQQSLRNENSKNFRNEKCRTQFDWVLKENKSLPGKEVIPEEMFFYCFITKYHKYSLWNTYAISQLWRTKSGLWWFHRLRSHKILTRLSGVSQTDLFSWSFEESAPKLCGCWWTQPTGENCLPRQGFIFFKAITGCLNYLKAMFVVLIQPLNFD